MDNNQTMRAECAKVRAKVTCQWHYCISNTNTHSHQINSVIKIEPASKLHIRVKCARLLSVMINIYLRQNIPLRVVHKKKCHRNTFDGVRVWHGPLHSTCTHQLSVNVLFRFCSPVGRQSRTEMNMRKCHRSCFALIIVINQWMTFVHLTLALSWLAVRFCTYRRSLFNNISNCSSCFYRNFICEMPWIEN